MESRLCLKRPHGMVRRRPRVRRRPGVVSDAVFKLYVWLCLHADSSRGKLHTTYDAICAAEDKSTDRIGTAVLICKVCYDRLDGDAIEITSCLITARLLNLA